MDPQGVGALVFVASFGVMLIGLGCPDLSNPEPTRPRYGMAAKTLWAIAAAGYMVAAMLCLPW